MGKKIAALAAASLVVATPAVAQSTIGALPAPDARVSSSIDDASDMEAGSPGLYILGAIVLGLAIYGFVELVDGDDSPTSP